MIMLRVTFAALLTFGLSSIASAADFPGAESWIFVSMPDFLNVDTDYPQPGWEPALDAVLRGVKSEEPDFSTGGRRSADGPLVHGGRG